MNMRDLLNKLDAVDGISEDNQKAFRQDPEGAIARAQAGANSMGLLGAMGGYALANMGRGNQNGGNMQPGGNPVTPVPMQPGTTTTTTGPAVPVGQPYLDTAHTINYNKPSGNIAGSPSNTTNKSPKGNDAQEDADIKKLNDLVAQLEKTKVPEKDTPHTGNIAGSPSGSTKPDIQGFQDAVLKVDPGALPRYGADGKMGTETQSAINAHPDIAAKFNLKENFNIADSLIESFGYQTEGEATLGQQAAVGAGGYLGAKGIGKMIGTKLPGVGLAFGAADAYNRAKKGDWLGAGLAGASGVASLMPGAGTAIAAGLDAANLARDYKHGEFDDVLPASWQQGHAAASPADTTKMPSGADPKVYDLQTKLLAKGAKNTVGANIGQPIDHDGKMGPNTQAAMKQFGIQAETVAESIASLRDRLAMIETEQQADEGLPSELVGKGFELGKDAWKGIKNFTKGAASPNVTPLPNVGLAKNVKYKGPGTAFKVGQAVGRNPGKTALAGTALGAGAGLALTPGGSKETPDTTPVVSIGGNNGNIAANPSDIDNNQPDVDTTPAGPTPEQQALLDQIKELMGHDYGDDPKWDAATSHAQSVVDKYTGANPLQQAMDQGHASGAANVAQTPSQSIAAMPSMNPQDKVKANLPNNMSYDQYKKDMDRSEPDAGKSNIAASPDNTSKSKILNPYQGADAAKFASFTPAQQAWLTKGGGVPDISGDEKSNPILYRMKSANPDTNNPTKTTSNWEEGINESDKELSRWLKIARG